MDEEQLSVATGTEEADEIESFGTQVAKGRPTGNPRSAEAPINQDQLAGASVERDPVEIIEAPVAGDDEDVDFVIPALNETDEDQQ